MFRLAVLAFLLVFALTSISSLNSWHGIAWLIVVIIAALAMLFGFVGEPAFFHRSDT